MHEKYSADRSDLWIVLSLESGLSTNKLSHNCLSQDLHVSSLCLWFCPMPESPGQKKLRLTKERLTNELRHRTENKLALLREQTFDRSTDIESRATQCNDRTPCLYACLFCFWLLVVNLLLAQWLYVKGRLILN